ncbi:MAG TPA: hypothetical protein VK666_09745 [Chryseolinea sp.]|nr:hypothetical protein [Chryseolinea sp.]
MKRLLFACAIAFASTAAQAQLLARNETASKGSYFLSPAINQSTRNVAYKISHPPGLRMRNAGMTMTIIGAALIISGIVVYSNAEPETYQTYAPYYYVEDDEETLGQAMVAVGAGLAIPGVIMWSKGAKKYNRTKEREATLNFKPGGFSLSYKF